MTEKFLQQEHRELGRSIDLCMIRDRHRLRRHWSALKKEVLTRDPLLFEDLRKRINTSLKQAEKRRLALPEPEFSQELPINQRIDEIRDVLDKHQVLILCGETGSGKSTQLPKVCLSMGRGVFGRIGHTQPRRIAARSLALRIASEVGQELGESIGYKVRFHEHVSPDTHVKLMTDGILLAEIQQDKWLNEYDTLIIDEAHERSLNIDFLLGYLKQLLPKRPDLKLIVTSATIDPERLSKHFNDAPIIEVSGRTYPVETLYRPLEEAASEREENFQTAILDAVDELGRIHRGDILIFLSGEREIRETADALQKHRLEVTEVLPLYARLGTAEQARIFRSSGKRRIVLATNVAETSLTVPGIRYVIDAGFARISRYSHRSKVQRLPVERISKASADQRKGRCGRVSEGVCIRLYAEDDYESRPDFTEPEIQRTNLASVILQMKILGFGDIHKFPFVDPPDSRLIKDGYRLLEELGAVDGDRRVTRLGKRLAKLPIDPRVGRMLLEAAHTHCLRELLIIGAALSVQDPRDRPVEKQQMADEAQMEFRDESSDFISYLKLWEFLEERRKHLSKRKFRELCRERFLSWTRVQEWHDIHHQLRGHMKEMHYQENQVEASYEEIHRAILSGLLSHIGIKSQGKTKDYLGARNSRFFIFPGSGLFAKQPKWVVAAELVETTKLYARGVARVEPVWVESLAGHLIKHHYSEPHWQKRRGQVGGYEKLVLFGLTVIPRRRINYGPIDPVVSREIFIRHALMEGDFESRAPFWRHNRELIASVHDMEAKSRRRDILVDEERIYQFYSERIPDGIYCTADFDKWLRKTTKTQPKVLHMQLQDLMRPEVGTVDTSMYPDEMNFGGLRLPLSYEFDPQHETDGITLVVPVAVLGQVSEERCEWLVPGILKERIHALLKALPKEYRKKFVPLPDTVNKLIRVLEPSDKPLNQVLSKTLREMTGVYLPETLWGSEKLSPHLSMNFRVMGDKGEVIEESRSLSSLKKKYQGQGKAAFDKKLTHELQREDVRDWDFGDLPESVKLQRSGISMPGFPALMDQGKSVDLGILDTKESAEQAHHAGTRRLMMLKLNKEVRYLQKQIDNPDQLRLQYAKAAAVSTNRKTDSGHDISDILVMMAFDRAFLSGSEAIRSRKAFEECLEAGKGRLVMEMQEVKRMVTELLRLYQDVRKRLSAVNQINWMPSILDMRQQLDSLVFRDFLIRVPDKILQYYPRYLMAIKMRIEKLSHAASRDQQRMAEMKAVLTEWQERVKKMDEQGKTDVRLDEIHWMLEELRVSLFSQELKTPYPISVKRIQKRWRELGL